MDNIDRAISDYRRYQEQKATEKLKVAWAKASWGGRLVAIAIWSVPLALVLLVLVTILLFLVKVAVWVWRWSV
jgi:preprotein translocase subunit SecF